MSHTATFSGLPAEVHTALSAYLPIRDSMAVSQTWPAVRAIYQSYTWSNCDVAVLAQDEYSDYRRQQQPSWDDDTNAASARRRVLPLACFLNPHRYSWFHPWAVQDICILNTDNERQDLWEAFLQHAAAAIKTVDAEASKVSGKDIIVYSALRRIRIAKFLDRKNVDTFIQSQFFETLVAHMRTIPELKVDQISIPMAIHLFDDEKLISRIPQKSSECFSYLTNLEIVGTGLFVSNLPEHMDLHKLQKLRLANVRTPILTHMLEQVALDDVAPRLRELECELGVYQRQKVIYAQSAIAALAKVPERIETCFLRVVQTEHQSGYVRVGTLEDSVAAAEETGVQALFTVAVVTRLKVDNDDFDITLFSQLVLFPRLNFLQPPAFRVVSPYSGAFSFDHFNATNNLTKLTYAFELVVHHEKIRSLCSLANLKYVQFYERTPEFVPHVPELYSFMAEGIRRFNNTGRVLDRDDIATMLRGEYSPLVGILMSMKPLALLEHERRQAAAEAARDEGEDDDDDDDDDEYDDDSGGESEGDEEEEEDAEEENRQRVVTPPIALTSAAVGVVGQSDEDEDVSAFFDYLVDFLAFMYQDPTECFLEYRHKTGHSYAKILLLGLCFSDAYFDIMQSCPRLEFLCVHVEITRQCYPSLGLFRLLAQHVRTERPDLVPPGHPCHAIRQIFLSLGSRDDGSGDTTREYNTRGPDEIADDDYYSSFQFGFIYKYPFLLKMRVGAENQFFFDMEHRRQFHVPEKRGDEGLSLAMSDFFKTDFDGWI